MGDTEIVPRWSCQISTPTDADVAEGPGDLPKEYGSRDDASHWDVSMLKNA